MKSKRLNFWLSFISLIPLLDLQSLHAQSADADPGHPGARPSSAGQLEEIVVTAQKRRQNINDVGVTITAATANELKAAGVYQIIDIGKIATGVNVGKTYAGFPVFSIRGVNFNAAQFSAQPAVSVYLDEAILPYGAQSEGVLLDVERVEVLKGPQGTLFGQNATGGSINVIANKPTSLLSAGAQLDLNNFGQTMIEGYISGPISGTLRARLSASTTQFGAWQKGYYLSSEKNGAQDKGVARLLLDWTPTDPLKVSLNLNGFLDRGENQASQVGTIHIQNPTGPFPPGLPSYPLPTNGRDADLPPNFHPQAANYHGQAVLRVDYDLTPDIRLTSVTNYLRTRYNAVTELASTAYPIMQYYDHATDETFNQELRLTGKADDGRLNYIAGANYQNDGIFEGTPYEKYFGYSQFAAGAELAYMYKIKNRTEGIFANADYKLLDTLTLTGGVRYTKAREQIDGCATANDLGIPLYRGIVGFLGGNPALYQPNGPCVAIDDRGSTPTYNPTSINDSQNENNTSFRVGANFQPAQNQLYYVLVSRGYKAGMFPALPTIFAGQFKGIHQEQLTSYEAGVKADIVAHRLHVNASAFYYDYRDKQFETFIFIPHFGPALGLVNIPSSKVKGIDLELTAKPTDRLSLRAAMTYVDTATGNFPGRDLFGNLTNYAGKEFSYAPPVSATLDAQYAFLSNDDLSVYVGGSVLYEARTFADLGEYSLVRLPSFAVFDARIGLDTVKGLRASLWVRNLADKYYWTAVVPGGDVESKIAGMPRTFGVTIGYSF